VAEQPNIASVLTSYAKPVREVTNGVPAYGLSLGGFSGEAGVATLRGGIMSHAFTFAAGTVLGILLGVRVLRR
jgi:hypothetical protein